MAKWADYLVSCVWYEEQNNSKHISHVLLHLDHSKSFEKGVITTATEVIKLLKSGKTVKTINWNYPGWMPDAPVMHGSSDGKDFLIAQISATVEKFG